MPPTPAGTGGPSGKVQELRAKVRPLIPLLPQPMPAPATAQVRKQRPGCMAGALFSAMFFSCCSLRRIQRRETPSFGKKSPLKHTFP